MTQSEVKPEHTKRGPVVEDWFWPAIACEGGVKDSFDAVSDYLQLRQNFVAALRQMLCREESDQLDAITLLSKEVGNLDNSLKFRLGILSADRPAAWFRPSLSNAFGPFQSGVLRSAVFAPYDVANVNKVKMLLRRAWHEKMPVASVTCMQQDESLWSYLLSLNVSLECLVKLPAPFESMRLDELPENLPEHLSSPMLVAFLGNVKKQILVLRQRLDGCYRELFQASEALWQYQQANQPTAASHRPADDYKSRAQSYRSQAKTRRTQRCETINQSYSARDNQALRQLGFSEMPGFQELRIRYISLAKKHHPDIRGGNEEVFKTINTAYLHLVGKLQLKSSAKPNTCRPR